MKNELIKTGYYLCRGAFRFLFECLAIGIVVMFLFHCLGDYYRWGVDDSDADGWHRSGLIILTDHRTGIQYLSTPRGGLTPRLNRDGKPIKP